jgi:hypothetical protein
MIESDVPLDRWFDSAPALLAARKAVLERLQALLERGNATVGELAGVI